MSGDTGRELATIVANVSADLFKDGTKVSATVTKEILLALLKNAKKRNEFKSGKVNLKKLINSGQEIKRVTIKNLDLKEFSKKAKSFGIAFTVVRERNNSAKDKAILFKVGDMELVKKVLEDIIDKKIEIKEIEDSKEKVINNDKEKIKSENDKDNSLSDKKEDLLFENNKENKKTKDSIDVEKQSVRENLKQIHVENTIKREQAKEEKAHDRIKQRDIDR